MAAPLDVEADGMDPFKISYKKYKRRNPPPDLSEVIDFDEPHRFSDKIERYDLNFGNNYNQDMQILNRCGLKPIQEWNVYRLKDAAGFIFIVNPFCTGYQRYWVKRCLKDFPEKPNMRNIDLYMSEESENIWESRVHKRDPSQSSSDKTEENKDLLSKLRWVTLGYHYNWGKKEYYGKKIKSTLPDDIGILTKHLASVLGFKDYHAQAGIVNYYNMGSTLGGHVDEAEFDMTAPLLSFSFGQTAIYLQGGKTRDTKPEAVFLKSGDIMIMSGETRWCYHSVPRILPPAKGKLVPECFKFAETEHGEGKSDGCNIAATSGKCGAELESFKSSTCCEDVRATKSATVNTEADENILQSDEDSTQRTIGEGKDQPPLCLKCSSFDCDNVLEQFDKDIEYLKDENNWKPFADYLHDTRINFNVRQVTKPGESFPEDLPYPGT